MHYTGPIYRPPFEAASLLLQVTVGCSHNRCSFCTMYRNVAFRMEPMEQIEKDLDEARAYDPHVKRVFLENGDPFVLSAKRLKAIAELIRRKLPEVEAIAMYASIHNIKTKSDEELKMLRALGVNELNIGVESGSDEALYAMRKGYTSQEALNELLRLRDAGMDYGANVIFGGAGSALRRENAVKTAELINKTQPYLLFTGTIHADPGCQLYDDMQTGAFQENTIGEYLEEEDAFLRHLDVENCHYFGLHPSNIVEMQGRLSQDKGRLISAVAQVRARLSEEQLSAKPFRYGEGAVVL